MTACWLQQRVHFHIVAAVGTIVGGEAAHPRHVHAQQDGGHQEQGRQAPARPQPDRHPVVVIVIVLSAEDGPTARSPRPDWCARQSETARAARPATETGSFDRSRFCSRARFVLERFGSGPTRAPNSQWAEVLPGRGRRDRWRRPPLRTSTSASGGRHIRRHHPCGGRPSRHRSNIRRRRNVQRPLRKWRVCWRNCWPGHHRAGQQIVARHAALQQSDPAAQLLLSWVEVHGVNPKEHVDRSAGESPIGAQVSSTCLWEQLIRGLHIVRGR